LQEEVKWLRQEVQKLSLVQKIRGNVFRSRRERAYQSDPVSDKNSNQSSGSQTPQSHACGSLMLGWKLKEVKALSEFQKLKQQCESGDLYIMNYPATVGTTTGLVQILLKPKRSVLLTFANFAHYCRYARMCLAVSATKDIVYNFGLLCGQLCALPDNGKGTSSPQISDLIKVDDT
jgi:hypothetical protein